MPLLFKTETYFSTKKNQQVTQNVLKIGKVNADGDGMTPKDVIIGKFKFEPRMVDTMIKNGPKAGQTFKPCSGTFEWMNPTDASKLDQFGGLKLDFTSAYKCYAELKPDWSKDTLAFSLKPFIGKEGTKAYQFLVEQVVKLEQEDYEFVNQVRESKLGWLDDVPKEWMQDESKQLKVADLKLPYWAIVCSNNVLAKIQGII
jgi:hypothetical protein